MFKESFIIKPSDYIAINSHTLYICKKQFTNLVIFVIKQKAWTNINLEVVIAKIYQNKWNNRYFKMEISVITDEPFSW